MAGIDVNIRYVVKKHSANIYEECLWRNAAIVLHVGHGIK